MLAASMLNGGKKLCKKCFCYLLTGPVARLTHSVSTSLQQITNEAAGKDLVSLKTLPEAQRTQKLTP